MIKASWEAKASLASTSKGEANFLFVVVEVADQGWHAFAKGLVIPSNRTISISVHALPAITKHEVVITHINELVLSLKIRENLEIALVEPAGACCGGEEAHCWSTWSSGRDQGKR